jgi:Holliday junction resolvase RusA-like endonuclease
MATSEAMSITFEVRGDPVPQPRPRHVNIGGRPMAFVPRDHAIHPYRAAIALAAQAAGVKQLAGPLAVHVEAVFGRPPSHLLKSGALRKGAPGWPRPDWDNIAKGVCDAIFAQDSAVVSGSCDKRYAVAGEPAHTRVIVTRRPDGSELSHRPAAADHP